MCSNKARKAGVCNTYKTQGALPRLLCSGLLDVVTFATPQARPNSCCKMVGCQGCERKYFLHGAVRLAAQSYGDAHDGQRNTELQLTVLVTP